MFELTNVHKMEKFNDSGHIDDATADYSMFHTPYLSIQTDSSHHSPPQSSQQPLLLGFYQDEIVMLIVYMLAESPFQKLIDSLLVMYNNLSISLSLQFHHQIDSHVTESDGTFLLDPMNLFVVEKTLLDDFVLYGNLNTRFHYLDSDPHDLLN